MEIEEVSKCIMSGDVRFVKELLRIFLRDQWLVLEGDRYRLFEFEPFDEAKFFQRSQKQELLTGILDAFGGRSEIVSWNI